jgi:F-type H+-transporting ATPase subunit epsilon
MLKIRVITKSKTIYTGEAEKVQLPGVDGLFGVLKNHAPMIFILKKGTIRLKKAGKHEDQVMINGGMMEVFKNELTVLAD